MRDEGIWPDNRRLGAPAPEPAGTIALLPRYLASRPWQRGLLLSEYRALGLAGLPAGAARDYLGAYGAARLALRINRLSDRRGLVGDKLLFDLMLRGAGLPVAELRAVFGRPAPPRTQRIGDEDALRRLLAEPAMLPLFGKPAMGQRSEDVIAIAGYDAATDEIVLPVGQRLPVVAFLDHLRRFHRRSGYLFQGFIDQHPVLSAIAGPTVATLRIITLVRRQDVGLLGVAWKVPRAGAVADNLWRGNMIAPVDPVTGRLGPALERLHHAAPRHACHPDSGAAIEGTVVPNWGMVLNQVKRAAGLMHVLPLVGWDIAVGRDGPVFVEANTSPSLDMLQFALGLGALAGEEGALLREVLAEIDQLDTQKRRDRRDRRRKLAIGKLRGR